MPRHSLLSPPCRSAASALTFLVRLAVAHLSAGAKAGAGAAYENLKHGSQQVAGAAQEAAQHAYEAACGAAGQAYQKTAKAVGGAYERVAGGHGGGGGEEATVPPGVAPTPGAVETPEDLLT